MGEGESEAGWDGWHTTQQQIVQVVESGQIQPTRDFREMRTGYTSEYHCFGK